MNTLEQYPCSDWILKNHGSAVNKTYTDGLSKCDITSAMAKWDWDKIIWGKVRTLVFNLQKRIYKATKSGRNKKAKSLMYLLNNSYYATLLAVRTVTTDNTGKRTSARGWIRYSPIRLKERWRWSKKYFTQSKLGGMNTDQNLQEGFSYQKPTAKVGRWEYQL
jgi:hypothetical protein